MQALSDAVRQGEVRYIGFSEWPVDKIAAAMSMAGVEIRFKPTAILAPLARARGEVFPFCRAISISQIVWSPLAQGVLTGKYIPGAAVPKSSRAASASMGTMFDDLAVASARSRSKDQAAGRNRRANDVAVCSCLVLREPNVASAIIGATLVEQIEENIVASGAIVDPSLFAEAEMLIGLILWLRYFAIESANASCKET